MRYLLYYKNPDDKIPSYICDPVAYYRTDHMIHYKILKDLANTKVPANFLRRDLSKGYLGDWRYKIVDEKKNRRTPGK